MANLHEIASHVWQQMRDALIEDGLLNLGTAKGNGKGTWDLVMIASIEAGFEEAARAEVEDNEARLALADNALLKFNKPIGGRILVDGSCLSTGDGHAVLTAGQELVVREKHGQVYITRRDA